MADEGSARDERSVASLYKDAEVVETYIQKRFSHSWSRLLHRKQVAEVNRVIRTSRPESILEVAPGPARIATDLEGVRWGAMLESSAVMLALAQRRLAAAGLEEVWQVWHGNAFDLDRLQRQFDFLYTFRFVRHFQQHERARLYRGIAACLQPRGLFMLDVVNRAVRQKLDAKRPARSQGDLDIYDATYSVQTFCQEMQTYGFEVLRLEPVLAYFGLQSWVSYRLDHRLVAVADMLVRVLEQVPSSQPLEWIALCRKAG